MSKGWEALKTLRHIHDTEHGQDYSINANFDIIEKELKEEEANKNASEFLRIIFNAPFIIQTLFEKGELGKNATDRYLWGTISDEEVKKIKELFSDGKI